MWQPIETAPKDGTAILAVIKGFQPVVVEYDPDVGWWYGGDDVPDDDWYSMPFQYEPTHWMPLPPAP